MIEVKALLVTFYLSKVLSVSPQKHVIYSFSKLEKIRKRFTSKNLITSE